MAEDIRGILKSYPNFKTGRKRRKSYLRMKSVDNQKCFFEIILGDKLKNHNSKDIERRIPIAKRLPAIFRTIKPRIEENKLIFESPEFCVVVKKILKKNKRIEHQLLSFYPK